MTKHLNEAPDPDSEEFLAEQITVDKLSSPDTSADEPAIDAGLISTDPTPSGDHSK